MKYEGAMTIKFDSSTATRLALEVLGSSYAEIPDWAETEWGGKKEKFRNFVGAFHWDEGRCASMVQRDCLPADGDFGHAVRDVLRIVAEALPGKAFSAQAVRDSATGPACDITTNYVGFGDIQTLEIFYPCGRLVLKEYTCRECGCGVVSAAECNPDQIYICPECGEEVSFEEECMAHEPEAEARTIHVKQRVPGTY